MSQTTKVHYRTQRRFIGPRRIFRYPGEKVKKSINAYYTFNRAERHRTPKILPLKMSAI